MKVLVIPDVHGRKFWRKAIADNVGQVEKVIFLGDYLDPYPQEIKENPDLMECADFYDSKSLLTMLNDIVSLKKNEPDKYILLTGNHSDSYIWSKFSSATRTDYDNWEKYHKFFSQNLNLFNFVWIEDNVIFSHAGILEEWAKIYCVQQGIDFTSIIDVAKVLQNQSLTKYDSMLGHISYHRGGNYFHGSCEWADICEHVDNYQSSVQEKIVPLGEDRIFQVFGHTQLQKPLITEKWACLDCRQGFIIDTITHDCVSCL